MTDRRLLKSNGRVAHVSLRGEVEAERFTDGEEMRIGIALADLKSAPDAGGRERQLGFGEPFTLLDSAGDHAFGFAGRDGAAGWIAASALAPQVTATHRVGVARTYAKSSPKLKTADEIMLLGHGACLRIISGHAEWLCFDAPEGRPAWLPAAHVVPVGEAADDPVSIAMLYLGTPYLWGGNSAYGIDCSGLVQAAWLACARACPPDSDLQEAMSGAQIDRDDLRRGDLVFWDGHVAIAESGEALIHANGYHMSTVREDADQAIARIGPPTSILRWTG